MMAEGCQTEGVGNVKVDASQLALKSFTGLPDVENSETLYPELPSMRNLQAKQKFRSP
jgi:hypothetical protein